MRRHFDERRTAFRNKGRRKLRSAAIDHVKRAAMCVENTGRALHDQPMQIRRAELFP